MKILITGGSGYVGTRLINLLLKNTDAEVINYDLSLYGDEHLTTNKRLKYLKKDIRDKSEFQNALKDKVDVVLHLACISNDPSFELNSKLSKEVNYDCFKDLVEVSKKMGVNKFIYASTSSVYGISDNPNVDETHPLKPITEYNDYKGKCEPILLDQINNDFQGIIIRPATVCGFSEKMRFDLSVNILTNFAYMKNFINIFGGEQYRPNIHIEDMCRLYFYLIFNDTKKHNGEIFNAGQENKKIKDIANIIKQEVEKYSKKEIKLNFTETDDIRSYRINSDKIQKILNFKFKFTIKDAVRDLCEAFKDGRIKDSFNSKYQNIKVLLNKKQENVDYLK